MGLTSLPPIWTMSLNILFLDAIASQEIPYIQVTRSVTHSVTHPVTELKSTSRSGFQAFQTIQRCQKGNIAIIAITAIMAISVSMAIAAIKAITGIRTITVVLTLEPIVVPIAPHMV